jgi:hypothetical protein
VAGYGTSSHAGSLVLHTWLSGSGPWWDGGIDPKEEMVCKGRLWMDLISVADPDPPDPHVFGPPGSGSVSISQRYGSGFKSFYHHSKIKRKIISGKF